MMFRISMNSISQKLSLLVKRFPMTILLVAGLSVLFFVAINNDFDSIPYSLFIFFSAGALISVTTTLFFEDFLDYIKTSGISLFMVLLWGIYCFFLPEKVDDIHTGKWIELSVIIGCALFSMVFISFLRKNKERAFWNFAVHTLFQITLSSIFGSILFGGLSLALLAINSLFNVDITDKVYAHLAVICCVLFSPIYFLANIPYKREKHNDDIFYVKIQKILVLYILTPILAVYMVILYAYLFKILVTWELPNGWVSWLVSTLALGGLLVITLLFSVREQEENRVATFISRWFGLIILPLLALMTIGIVRRISDYGLTINRGYLFLLNFWFYGIYIYLFFTKSRDIKWILISPVVVAFLSSIHIWGVANIAKNSLTKEIHAVFKNQVSTQEAIVIFLEMTQEERDRIKSTLEYIHTHYGKESVQPFFTDTVPDSSYRFLSDLGLTVVIDKKTVGISYRTNNKKTLNIDSYHFFTQIDYFDSNLDDDLVYASEKDTIEISADYRTFAIPLREFVLTYLSTEEKCRNELELIVKGDDFTVLITHFSGNYYPERDTFFIHRLQGYLFYI